MSACWRLLAWMPQARGSVGSVVDTCAALSAQSSLAPFKVCSLDPASCTHRHVAAVHVAQCLKRDPLLPQPIQLPGVAAGLLQQPLQLWTELGCLYRVRQLLLQLLVLLAAATRCPGDGSKCQQRCCHLRRVPAASMHSQQVHTVNSIRETQLHAPDNCPC